MSSLVVRGVAKRPVLRVSSGGSRWRVGAAAIAVFFVAVAAGGSEGGTAGQTRTTPDAARQRVRQVLEKAFDDVEMEWPGDAREAAGGGIPDGVFERWYAGASPERIRALAAEELELDAEGDEPIFDDGWWPAGLSALGVARPGELDERIAEPWEWSARMLRLVGEADASGVPMDDRVDLCSLASRLVQRFDFEHRRRAEVLRGPGWWSGPAGEDPRAAADRLNELMRASPRRTLDEWKRDRPELFDTTPGNLWDAALEYFNGEIGREEAEARLERGGVRGGGGAPELLAWVDRAIAELDAAIAEEAEAVRRAASRRAEVTFAVPVPPALGWWTPMTLYDGAAVRRFVRHEWAMSAAAIEQGRVAGAGGAAERLGVVLAVADTACRVPSLPTVLMAHSVARDAAGDLFGAMAGRRVDAAELAAISAALDRFDPPPMSYNARGDMLAYRASLDDFVGTVRGRVPASLALRRSMAEIGGLAGAGASRGVQMALADVFDDAWAATLDPASLPNERERAWLVLGWLTTAEAARELSRTMIPISLLAPKTTSIHDVSRGTTTAFNGMRTVLAIEAYRLDHGRPPTSLDDLPEVVGFGLIDASALPAASTAVPPRLRYRVLDPDAGREAGFAVGYLLYSVGLEGAVDARGEPPPHARYQWKVTASGDNGGRTDPVYPFAPLGDWGSARTFDVLFSSPDPKRALSDSIE